MRDKIWKWFGIGIVVVNLAWMGWQARQWKRGVDVHMAEIDVHLSAVDMRLGVVEGAVLGKHPELGQKQATPSQPPPAEAKEK